ncbi:hypothetical protein AeRB84_017916 [Aphanomyces euteiches]|nr:hypothetical protein AeRB84_017916 [Aphanomyces euteiches]
MVEGHEGRGKKGKNFNTHEEEELVRAWLNVSQDASTGTGQKSETFWARVRAHYSEHFCDGDKHRPQRSLQSKWLTIQHDVSKFVAAYAAIINESDTNDDDLLQKAQALYLENNPKKIPFAFLHCWYILRGVRKWWDMRESSKVSHSQNVADHRESDGRPEGSKTAKRLKLEKDAGCEDTLQAKKSIAESQRRRADLLEMQTHLALFSANTEDMDEDCKMFFQISRRAVLDKLQKNMN